MHFPLTSSIYLKWPEESLTAIISRRCDHTQFVISWYILLCFQVQKNLKREKSNERKKTIYKINKIYNWFLTLNCEVKWLFFVLNKSMSQNMPNYPVLKFSVLRHFFFPSLLFHLWLCLPWIFFPCSYRCCSKVFSICCHSIHCNHVDLITTFPQEIFITSLLCLHLCNYWVVISTWTSKWHQKHSISKTEVIFFIYHQLNEYLQSTYHVLSSVSDSGTIKQILAFKMEII